MCKCVWLHAEYAAQYRDALEVDNNCVYGNSQVAFLLHTQRAGAAQLLVRQSIQSASALLAGWGLPFLVLPPSLIHRSRMFCDNYSEGGKKDLISAFLSIEALELSWLLRFHLLLIF